jgi:hypothetical protein
MNTKQPPSYFKQAGCFICLWEISELSQLETSILIVIILFYFVGDLSLKL